MLFWELLGRYATQQLLVLSAVWQREVTAIEDARETELGELLGGLLKGKLPYYPRPVRGGGLVKQASFAIPCSAWKWNCLTMNTPIDLCAVLERIEVESPHNALQAHLFRVEKLRHCRVVVNGVRARSQDGRSWVEALGFAYNPNTRLLRVTVRAESANASGHRVILCAPTARIYQRQTALSRASILLDGDL